MKSERMGDKRMEVCVPHYLSLQCNSHILLVSSYFLQMHLMRRVYAIYSTLKHIIMVVFCIRGIQLVLLAKHKHSCDD